MLAPVNDWVAPVMTPFVGLKEPKESKEKELVKEKEAGLDNIIAWRNWALWKFECLSKYKDLSKLRKVMGFDDCFGWEFLMSCTEVVKAWACRLWFRPLEFPFRVSLCPPPKNRFQNSKFHKSRLSKSAAIFLKNGLRIGWAVLLFQAPQLAQPTSTRPEGPVQQATKESHAEWIPDSAFSVEFLRSSNDVSSCCCSWYLEWFTLFK